MLSHQSSEALHRRSFLSLASPSPSPSPSPAPSRPASISSSLSIDSRLSRRRHSRHVPSMSSLASLLSISRQFTLSDSDDADVSDGTFTESDSQNDADSFISKTTTKKRKKRKKKRIREVGMRPRSLLLDQQIDALAGFIHELYVEVSEEARGSNIADADKNENPAATLPATTATHYPCSDNDEDDEDDDDGRHSIVSDDDVDSQEAEVDYLSSMFPNWTVGRLLGTGTSGMVFEAMHPISLAPLFAIKRSRVVNTHPWLPMPTLFSTIVKVLRLADHPNILRYYGVEQVGDEMYTFMEFCGGGSLHDRIYPTAPTSANANPPSKAENATAAPTTTGIKDEASIQLWIKMILEGLRYCHRHGIIHRDLKPGNLLVCNNGVVKIADFGGAKIHQTCCQHAHLTQLFGSPSYMAPEIITSSVEGRQCGAQDMWSLGCCLFEMVLGKPPWYQLDNVFALYYLMGTWAKKAEVPEGVREGGCELHAGVFVEEAVRIANGGVWGRVPGGVVVEGEEDDVVPPLQPLSDSKRVLEAVGEECEDIWDDADSNGLFCIDTDDEEGDEGLYVVAPERRASLLDDDDLYPYSSLTSSEAVFEDNLPCFDNDETSSMLYDVEDAAWNTVDPSDPDPEMSRFYLSHADTASTVSATRSEGGSDGEFDERRRSVSSVATSDSISTVSFLRQQQQQQQQQRPTSFVFGAPLQPTPTAIGPTATTTKSRNRLSLVMNQELPRPINPQPPPSPPTYTTSGNVSREDILASAGTARCMLSPSDCLLRTKAMSNPLLGVAMESGMFSYEGLDFLSLCLQWNPDNRPSADELLSHPFVASVIYNVDDFRD